MATLFDVAVVGGGITGLTTAYDALARDPGLRVAVFEGSDRLGGKIHTTTSTGSGSRPEPTPSSRATTSSSDCARTWGSTASCILRPCSARSCGRPTARNVFPPGTVMGVPSSAGAVLGAEPLSIKGKLRALADLVLPGPLSGPDVAVGPFIRKRFGAEVLERMVDPILAGTRAGDPGQAQPVRVHAADRSSGAHEAKRHVRTAARVGTAAVPRPQGRHEPPRRRTRCFASDADVRTNEPVRAVHPGADGYRLTLDGGDIDARSLVLAVPAPAAARSRPRLRVRRRRGSTRVNACVGGGRHARLSVGCTHPPERDERVPRSERSQKDAVRRDVVVAQVARHHASRPDRRARLRRDGRPETPRWKKTTTASSRKRRARSPGWWAHGPGTSPARSTAGPKVSRSTRWAMRSASRGSSGPSTPIRGWSSPAPTTGGRASPTASGRGGLRPGRR